MRVGITQYLSFAPFSVVDIPGIESWDEIKDWYVKWDTLHYTLDGETFFEIELNSASEDIIAWKHPEDVEICEPDEYECASEETIE